MSTPPGGGRGSGQGTLAFDAAPPAGERILSVFQLVRAASRKVEALGDLWVEGEVSNLRRPSSGHAYFTLKDKQAQISVVIFRSTLRRVRCELTDGGKLRLHGKLTIYEPQGRFQLTADRVEEAGEGALMAAVERLKRELAQEGLFDARHKKAIPPMPRWIAVVTSRSGAAFADVLTVLARRCPVRVTLVPTAVQGPEAPFEIRRALKRADALGADLIIVGRGGGSLEDLQAFNHEGVARSILALETPVISAVGHEVDHTIADLVADLRAPTPTAAAELAVPEVDQLASNLALLSRRLRRAQGQRLSESRLALERLRRQLASPQSALDRRRQRVDELGYRLAMVVRRRLAQQRGALVQLDRRLGAQHPAERLVRDGAKLAELRGQLQSLMNNRLQRYHALLGSRVSALSALSPLAVLARGYSLTQGPDGRLVRDSEDVGIGDALRIRLDRGILLCEVTGREGETPG